MQQIYQFLHFLVTLIFSFLLNFRYYFKLTRRKLRGVFLKESDIKSGVATLTSLPRHLTLILLEKDVDLCILARLVIWSITAGISFISVHATHEFVPGFWLVVTTVNFVAFIVASFTADSGELEKRRNAFYHEVHLIKQEMSSCDYELHFKDKDLNEQNGVNGAGHKSIRKVFVSLLSHHEGKEDIANAAQTFCMNVKNKATQSEVMNIEHLSTLLVNKDFPDPDLAMKFGHSDSIFDYPPWQLRLTEFISVPSLQLMDKTLFLQTLQQYSNCEKRLGK